VQIPMDASAADPSLPPGFQITVTVSRPTMVVGDWDGRDGRAHPKGPKMPRQAARAVGTE